MPFVDAHPPGIAFAFIVIIGLEFLAQVVHVAAQGIAVGENVTPDALFEFTADAHRPLSLADPRRDEGGREVHREPQPAPAQQKCGQKRNRLVTDKYSCAITIATTQGIYNKKIHCSTAPENFTEPAYSALPRFLNRRRILITGPDSAYSIKQPNRVIGGSIAAKTKIITTTSIATNGTLL